MMVYAELFLKMTILFLKVKIIMMSVKDMEGKFLKMVAILLDLFKIIKGMVLALIIILLE